MVMRQRGHLELVGVPGKGRGVVSRRPIPAGRVIEVCPAVPVAVEEVEHINKTVLASYLLPYVTPDFVEAVEGEHPLALVGGYACFYNHSDTPNAEYFAEERHGGGVILFRAIRPIAAHEEITIDYGDGEWNVEFDAHGRLELWREARDDE